MFIYQLLLEDGEEDDEDDEDDEEEEKGGVESERDKNMKAKAMLKDKFNDEYHCS